MYVLDTNIVVAALNGDERAVGPLRNLSPSDVTVPLVVIAELLYGPFVFFCDRALGRCVTLRATLDSNQRPSVPEADETKQNACDSREMRVVKGNVSGPLESHTYGPVHRETYQNVTAPDPVELALADALKGATEAGAWDTVAQLARELQARREARAGVVKLDDQRRRRGVR